MSAPTREPEEIANSNEILAINVLLDECRDSLLSRQHSIRARMTRILNEPPPHGAIPYVNTRTSREEGGRDSIPLLFNNYDLKDLAELIGLAIREEHLIAELQRFKLRLMNDYDFTHGSPWTQYAVFGPPPELTDDFVVLTSDDDSMVFATTDPARAYLLEKLGKPERFRPTTPLLINGEELVPTGRGYYAKETQRETLLAFLRESGFTLTVTEARG